MQQPTKYISKPKWSPMLEDKGFAAILKKLKSDLLNPRWNQSRTGRGNLAFCQ
ncbi:hypothetical protein SESBI_50367 [Sesbania bispinosa]|nr:hypothetical protein SESBI_50367 [Sesbania bispinosa]